MKIVLVLLVSSCVAYSQALECGLSKVSDDQIKKVVAECAKDDQTLSKILELASTVSNEEENESGNDTSVSSDEEVPVTKGLGNNNNRNNTKNVKGNETASSAGGGRSKRSRNAQAYNGGTSMWNMQRNYGASSTTTEQTTTVAEEETSEESTDANAVGESDEVCVLQCVFEKLELTDSNGLPDHKKFAAALVKTATAREIRDFLQDSADECFQQISQGDTGNPCDSSTKLMSCLAEKGKSNCEDWPVGNLPF